MKKTAALTLTLALMAGLCTGCGDADSSGGDGAASGSAGDMESVIDGAGATSGSAAEATPAFHGIDAPGFERTMENAKREASGEKYVHGEDGYFLLADHGADTELKIQKGLRDSWVYAASTSMESSSLVTKGEKITVDPYVIRDLVYDENRKEGIRPVAVSNKEIGGHGKYIVDTLTNGFGDRLLVTAIDCEHLSIDRIKDAIRTHGGMTAGMTEAHNGRGFYDGYFTQYDEENKNDHTVTIVGWDDHFPKEIFTKTSFVPMPSQDGAWIAQDSLMNTDYIYISYDTQILDAYIYELSDEYSDVATYDGGCEGSFGGVAENGFGKNGITVANVYHKKGTLGAVGTYITADNDNLKIRIVDEKTGRTLDYVSQSFDMPGYYTIPLTKPIEVQDYRIEITYEGSVPVEGEKWTSDDGYVRFKPTIQKGQSFVRINKKWCDLAEKTTVKKMSLPAGFTPHNVCIKGLYIK